MRSLVKTMFYVILVLAFTGSAASASSYVTQDTLAFWDFSELELGSVLEEGQRILDQSGNKRDLVVAGGTGGIIVDADAGLFSLSTGPALRFLAQDGQHLIYEPGYDFDDGGDAANPEGFVFGWEEVNNNWTIEFAVRLTTTVSNQAPFTQRAVDAGGSDPQFWTRFDARANRGPGHFQWHIIDSVGTQSGGNWSPGTSFDGQWYHVAMVRNVTTSPDGEEFTVYVNYEKDLVRPDLTWGDWSISADPFAVAGWPGVSDRDLIGSMAFMRVTARDLSPEEFIQLDPKPSNPDPVDRAFRLPTSVTLSWDAIDGVDNVSETVTVATDSDFNNIVEQFENVQGSSVSLANLSQSTKYYWVVDTEGTVNSQSVYYEGDVWSFTTEEANPLVAGYWTFDDGTPGEVISESAKIADISGNNRHLYLLARDWDETPWPDSEYDFPNAAYGSSASYYGQAGAQLVLEPGFDFGGEIAGSDIEFDSDDDFTIEAVIRLQPEQTNINAIFSYLPTEDDRFFYGNNVPQYWFRVQSDGRLRMWNEDGEGRDLVTGQTDLRTGQWHHVAVVRDTSSRTLNLYVDGQLDGESEDHTGLLRGSGKVALAGFHSFGARDFMGNIDFVKVTREALAPEAFVQGLPLPSNPDPADGASGVPAIEYFFSWDPAEGMISEQVLFGTDPAMADVSVIQPVGSMFSIDLEAGTTYYWAVETTSSQETYLGPIWTFSTPQCVFGMAEGDLTGDCRIDFADFAIMADNWLRADEFED